MTDKEQTTVLIDRLMDVRRALKANDREKELSDQEQILVVKLEALGVTVSNLPD